tara:strand:- start:416 stop:1048 length:633 start_codon:yes stop_codon:yes gene_type:complete
MSWLLDYKKYRKKVKELLFARSELEYQETVLSDAHHEFEEYYLKYCAENGIDLKTLKEGKEQKVEDIFTKVENDKNALIHKPMEPERKKLTKAFNSIYKEVAKKIHPDKISIFLPEDEIREKESMFKTAASAMDVADWGKLLEVADKLNIKPKNFEGISEEIDLEIEKINKIVKHNNNTYSWVWANCESEACKEDVVKNFLHQLFGYNPS